MEEKMVVKHIPVQRNAMDVAVELTQLYFSFHIKAKEEDIKEKYMEFYSIAKALEYINPKDLKELVPEKIRHILEKY